MPLQRTSTSEQIARELRAQIEAGDFKPGEALPADSALAARFGVSKPTITKARAMLVAIGLVTSRAGAASIVREDFRVDAVSVDHHVPRASRTGRIYPEGHYTRIVQAGLVAAAPEVSRALASDPASDVIERRRVTHAADDSVLAALTTYFPADLTTPCPALLETERITQGTTLYIEQQTGRIAASIAANVSCRPADADPAGDGLLRLPPKSYVLILRTTTYDSEGAAIAHEVEFHPPDTTIALDVIDVSPPDLRSTWLQS